MSPRVIDREEKRLQIIKAAIKIFAMKGVAKTRMSEIAEQAGIGKGTIYEYFKSKDEIVSSAFYFFMDELNTIVAKKIYRIFDPVKKLECFFDAWIEVLDSPQMEFIEVMVDFWAEGIRSKESGDTFDLAKMYKEYRLMVQNLLDDCIMSKSSDDMDTQIMASIIIGALDGLMIQWIVDRDAYDIKEATRIFKDMFLKGVIKER